jgi:hypothetical protein
MTQHIDYINSKQTDFYGFDILSDRKYRPYKRGDLEINLGDDTLSKKYKTIFEDEK